MSLTTRDDGCSLLLTRLDITHDSVSLELRDLRTLESGRLERIADDELLSGGLECLCKLVVDSLLDVDSRTSAAGLSVVEAKISGYSRGGKGGISRNLQDTLSGVLDRVLKVGVVEDNV